MDRAITSYTPESPAISHAECLSIKNKLVPGFTSRYNLTRLVYYECFVYPGSAINREKEIKAWRRNKKIALIESMNPHWYDLAERWSDIYKPDQLCAARQIPPSA